jgi:hypothetical protein
MCNEDIHNLYFSPDIIRMIRSRRMRFVGHVAHMGEIRNAYKILVWRCEGKTILGRHGHEWEDTVKMALKEIKQEGD